ncbi:hypothetical protein [Salinisphaera hydrothermalis]|uniref:hypothetical protein n=1 Tax=Salinisphaera hydrothermalis TaxID=563188 RepID=UPI003DA7340C
MQIHAVRREQAGEDHGIAHHVEPEPDRAQRDRVRMPGIRRPQRDRVAIAVSILVVS